MNVHRDESIVKSTASSRRSVTPSKATALLDRPPLGVFSLRDAGFLRIYRHSRDNNDN